MLPAELAQRVVKVNPYSKLQLLYKKVIIIKLPETFTCLTEGQDKEIW